MANVRIFRRKVLGMSATGGAGPMRGWKDTFGANPDQVTRILQRFEPPAGATVPQKYVYHCHILAHEDNDTMRPHEVV
ncbi:MAG TPA: multicopper oxidase domain-containing protein [Rubrobacter sp.]|jgi:FtsP/CotA-like multicopper oxidase with cupredoxin domain|nr:multicopper oxidase domain-containing protein [Rubrobacter sp.]